MTDLTPFDVARSQLVDFVKSFVACVRVCWVFREDFYGRDRHHVVVPRHVPPSNSALARRIYAPLDGRKAEIRMISGLELNLREPLPSVVQENAVSWWWRRLASRAYRRQVHINWFAPLPATLVA